MPLPGVKSKSTRTIDNSIKRSFYLRDPDGLGIEFFVEREPDFASLNSVAPSERAYYV